MRVCLITPGFSASESDWCIPALLNLVRELTAEHQVTVLALRYPHHREPYSVYGAEVLPLGGAEIRGLRRAPLLLRARQALRRQSFDVLHAMWAHEPGFVATLAARKHGPPVIVSVLGGELAGLPEISYGGQITAANRFLIGRALANASVVTVGSRTIRGEATRRVESRRLRLVPLGVDTTLFSPPARSRDTRQLRGARRILQVGSLSPIKGQATLLEAFATVLAARPDCHLHLVGEGPLEAVLRKRIADLDLTESVTLHGPVAHDRLPSYYRAADLCVQSSLFESQGMVVLEAASCGTRTVGTKTGILPELSRPALLASPGDPASLAAALFAGLDEAEQTDATDLAVPSAWRLTEACARISALYSEVAG